VFTGETPFFTMAKRPNILVLKPFENSNLYLRRMEDKMKPSASASEVNELEGLLEDLTSNDVPKGIQNQPLPQIPSLNSVQTYILKNTYANSPPKLPSRNLKPSNIDRYCGLTVSIVDFTHSEFQETNNVLNFKAICTRTPNV
jgi:hypothetical protein